MTDCEDFWKGSHFGPFYAYTLISHNPHLTMFTSLTNRSKFGATYAWAILSVLPMDNGTGCQAQDGMRPTDINAALGMPNEARTGLSMLLKVMAAQGLIKRHELGPRWVEYTRLLPLRKRERVARMLWG